MIRLWRVVAPLSIAAVMLAACRKECKVPPLLEAPVETSDILVSNGNAGVQPLGVDICIDATPSMDGFTASPQSIYNEFLQNLEGSFGLGRETSLRYFKFGETIREVPRDEFLNARSRAFYHEPGIFRTTNIELVFGTGTAAAPPKQLLATTAGAAAAKPRPDRRVTVVVTDLFQRDQDVTAVVQQIQRRCLSSPECSVALLPIPSQFDGTVHDARVPKFPYRSTSDAATFRPFYLLMFGPEEELRRFGDVLSGRPYIDMRHFTVIGRRTVAEFSADVVRDVSVQGTQSRSTCPVPFSTYLNLMKNRDRAAVRATLRIKPDPHSFTFRPARVSLRAFREVGGKRIPADRDVSATITPAGDSLEVAASIRPPGEAGDHLYVFEAVTGDVNGFVLPSWVAGFTSSDPRPERDPAKTLNLDRFVEQLIATSVLEDHHRPRLARFRVLIHKL
jgi:hypothetical protein